MNLKYFRGGDFEKSEKTTASKLVQRCPPADQKTGGKDNEKGTRVAGERDWKK